MAKKKKENWFKKLLKAVVVVYLLLLFCQVVSDIYSGLGTIHKIPVSEEWNLIVVNRWNELPEDYSVELTELSNGQKVDSRIYPALQEMFDAARAEGIYPIVREGYRTAKEWVALPGTSEHQLGTAVDINADKSKCSNEEVYAWLSENAYKYGLY